MSDGDERPAPEAGFVAPELRAEFPGLRLEWIEARGGRRPSPRALRRRLGELSNRDRGATVVALRTRPIPRAYRTFFRQIGLDPDVQRIPAEQAAVNRLLYGGFRSVDLVADACLVALIETAVPVWAIDADAVDEAGLGIRTATAADAEAAPGDGALDAAPPGSLVVADGQRVHAVLFAAPLPGREVGVRTRRMLLFAVAVDGVPEIHVEEALWLVAELVGSDPPGC